MNERKQELIEIFEGADKNIKKIVTPLIDDVIYLEDQLKELRKLPMIRVKQDNNSIQKATPASKLYKELLQQYNNCIKILCSCLKNNEGEEISPLRAWVESQNERL